MDSDFSQLLEQTGLSKQETAMLCGVSARTIHRWEKGECPPHPLATEKLQQIRQASARQHELPLPEFRFIDLFAGIGGFRKAFDAIGGQCVFTSEWDKNCRKTYLANFDCDHPIAGDIRDYTASDAALDTIPEHDVLVAGFPCQPFSIAGVSKKNAMGRLHGFKCDTQGTLFFDIARIIEHHRPKAFLLENVKNLMSHDKGQTFRVIKRTLEEELGYHISFRVIDGSSWVPQKRKRILIAGFREDVGFSFDDLPVPPVEAGPTMASVLHSADEPDEAPYTVNHAVGSKYVLTPKLWEYLQNYRKKHEAAGNGFGFGLVGKHDVARTLSARYHKDGSEILVRRGRGRPRRLTPRECARIMGFDAPHQSDFVIPVSDTQAYRQFGNSVIVPMALCAARHMKSHIVSHARINL